MVMLSSSQHFLSSSHSQISATPNPSPKTPPLVTSECSKLPLLHRNPFPTPSQEFSSDAHRRKKPQPPLTSGAATGSGQYFVDLRLGTPPQSLLLVADIGSDLVWVTCSACHNYSNHAPNSAFLLMADTGRSSSKVVAGQWMVVWKP